MTGLKSCGANGPYRDFRISSCGIGQQGQGEGRVGKGGIRREIAILLSIPRLIANPRIPSQSGKKSAPASGDDEEEADD